MHPDQRTTYLISDISLLIILGIGLFIVDTVVAFSTLLIFSVVAIVLYRALHLKVRVLGKVQSDLLLKVTREFSKSSVHIVS